MKTYSVNKICDVYLYRLYKLEKNKKSPEFLVNILYKRGIYFDNNIVNETLEILINKNFISLIEGYNCTFTYGKKKDKRLIFPWRKINSKKFFDDFFSEDFLNKIEGRNYLYKLTIQGKNFVQNSQFLDIVGQLECKKKKEEWVKLFWSFIIILVSGIILAYFTYRFFQND